MILPDINLLLYAYNQALPQHQVARNWWENALNSMEPVAVPWIISMGFIRLCTHPRVLNDPLTAEQAVGCVESWLERPHVLIIEPGQSFSSLLFRYLRMLGTGGNMSTDAYLAALAVEHQAELQSNDTDFHRFPGLRWRNPLER